MAVVVVVFLLIANRPPAPLVSVSHPRFTTPPSLAHDRSLGSASAPVTLDVWSDFQCPFCQQFWTTVEPQIVSTYVAPGKVRLVYHDYTFLGQESIDAAIAARCADRQGKFWDYHDYLFANQGAENSGAFAPSRLTQLAQAVGLDMTAWTACLKDPTVGQAIQQETAAGTAAGVTGTPTIFVDGKQIAGYSYTAVSAAIDAALAAKGASPGAGSSPVAGSSPGAGSSAAASSSAATGSSPGAGSSAAASSSAATGSRPSAGSPVLASPSFAPTSASAAP